MKLPASLTLPTGASVRLHAAAPPASPRERAHGAPLFSDVLALFDAGAVTLEDGKDIRDLALPDFHALRAVLTKAGYVAEDAIEISCANCGATIKARPCEHLEIGPFVDGELDDPELDVLDDVGVPHEVEGLGTVTLARRTVREAEPLFRAVARDPLEITAEVATAMGVSGVGARDLAKCDEDAWDEVIELFLRANYPLRLGAVLFCPSCKARNDVDAPYERELAPQTDFDRNRGARVLAIPSFDEFAERTEAIAEPMLAAIPGEKVVLVVEGGTPAVDDGGEPLLGAYVPGHPPTVTVYYKTFCAMEADGGPYDWEAELEETIEHELEHHVYALRGDDPMDAAERAEIDREALRLVGRREATRRTFAAFGSDVGEFIRRAWPLLVIALAVLVLTLLAGRRD